MLPIQKPLLLAALLFALAPLCAAQPLTLADAQGPARELAARAAAGRLKHLSCSPLPPSLECTVDGERRAVAIAGDGFRAYYPEASSKIELLAPGITHDYDVYYEFERSAFEALAAGRTTSLSGVWVENVERTPSRSTPAKCVVSQRRQTRDSYYELTGDLDPQTKALTTSRGQGASPLIDVSRGWTVDERCGTLAAPTEYSLNYSVTPQNYWGEDVLQLPQSALRPSAEPFQANLHLCQYDGDWHASEDVALLCTLGR